VITAAYNGNDNCNASSGTTTVQVTAAPSTPSLGLCLLCNGVINLSVENVGNVSNVDNIYNIGDEVRSHRLRESDRDMDLTPR